MGEEKRQNKRFAERLVVQWQPQLSPEAPPTEDWHYAFIHNISCGGLYFETPKPVSVGDLLYFRIKIHFSLWPFTCTGQALRVVKKPTGMIECGVKFITINTNDAELIDLLAWEQDQNKQTGGTT